MSTTTPSPLTLTAATRPGQWQLTLGATSYPIMLRPEQDVGLGDLLRRLPAVLVGGRDSARQLAPDELLRAVGVRLWEALCPADAPAEARAALAGQLRQDGTPLLLDLPPALRGLPWELLCDPDAPDDTGFLTRRRPLARLVAGAASLPPLAPPLKVLLLIASPPGLEEYRRVDVESERAAVETATRDLRAHGLLHLLVEDVVSPRRVQQALLRFRPHVLHYIGHGGFQQDVGWCLEWEDEQGQPLPHPDTRIADLLRPRGLRAVLLHGCDTAVGDTRADIQGVAGALLAAGVPAVLAQQSKLTYESSQRASEAFYTALTAGLGLAEATFEVRLALQQAERPDWAVPILQAAPAGLAPLLDPSAAPSQSDPALAPPPPIAGLPAPTQVFVGRQRELRALRAMLESAPGSGPVLALITGPGGVGKSTLAAQAVVRSGQRYQSGLLLSCRGYAGVDLFLNQIGAFLTGQGAPQLAEGILPDPKLPLDAKIRAAVAALNAAGPFLVVIDNLETVQDEQRRISDPDLLTLLQTLLFELRGGRVLVTGRYGVAGLLPDDKFQASLLRLDLDDLSGREIRQLLQRHPTLAQLGQAVQDELVSAFGGLPYVYDLLSSEAAGQDLAGIISDIQGRISQERQQRTAEEWARVRQQVVEFAALESTLVKLDDHTRKLLDTLSVFRKPFPQHALEQGLGQRRSNWQPLVDWALLRYDVQSRYYQLHSLTSAYVRERMPVDIRRMARHQVAQWYLNWAEQSRLLNDYLEAHMLLVEAGVYIQAGQLANEIGWVLYRFGLHHIWRNVCDKTIQTCSGSILAEAKRQRGTIAQYEGNVIESKRLHLESLLIFEDLNNLPGCARVLSSLGLLMQEQGQIVEAQQHYLESLSISRELGDESGEAVGLYNLGMIAQAQDNIEQAIEYFNNSISIKYRLGDLIGQANAFHQLAVISQNKGLLEQARDYYVKNLSTYKQLGDVRGQGVTLNQLGTIAQEQGFTDEARRLYNESLSIFENIGYNNGIAGTLQNLGALALDNGNLDEALKFIIRAMIIFEQIESPNTALARQTIASIRIDIEEDKFELIWSMMTNKALNEAPIINQNKIILQSLREFIELQTWDESQAFLEEHPELLSPTADSLLKKLAADQNDDRPREMMEIHRKLLVRCRDIGIEAAFKEFHNNHEIEHFDRQINELLFQVVDAFLYNDVEKRKNLTDKITELAEKDIPFEGARDFLTFIIDWLNDKDVNERIECLSPDFQDTYHRMIDIIFNERLFYGEIQQISQDVYNLLVQGTIDERNEYISNLSVKISQLPPDESAFRNFLSCLIGTLQGKLIDANILEEPFAGIWHHFQAMLDLDNYQL
ncbi:MAG TPA: tetratricopeptide repeat protein [Roseiflexaceae bacterium]|nr:tetratricopeptide repeat protein [Roseiflexaceae bacterium]